MTILSPQAHNPANTIRKNILAHLSLKPLLINQEWNMKKVNAIAGRAVLAVSLTVACALPLHAQNTAATDPNATSTTTVQTVPVKEDKDYGWIGLLGLAGLLGLRRKKEEHIHRTTTTTTNPR
jgi:MYXO-CTERM domain-containing protein